jgi:seryl-tRNA synthetase
MFQTQLNALNAQGQEFSKAGAKIAKADIIVETRLLAEIPVVKKQALATLTSQLKPFQKQLQATLTADNAMIQAFATNFFSSFFSGNSAMAQADLQIITALQSMEVSAVNVFNFQATAAVTNYNARIAVLNNIASAASDFIANDKTILLGP